MLTEGIRNQIKADIANNKKWIMRGKNKNNPIPKFVIRELKAENKQYLAILKLNGR